MARWKVILIAVVCVAAGAVIAVVLLRPEVQKIDIDRNQPSDQPQLVPQVLTKLFPIEENERYTVAAEYPELDGVATPGVQERVNGSIRAGIYNRIAAFQAANSANLPLGDLQLRSSFDASFEVQLLTNSFFSALMSYSDYSAGAAHPNDYLAALNYDLRTGDAVSIDRLLRSLSPSEGYMERLGTRVQGDLVRQFGDSEEAFEVIKDGAAPTAANYAVYTLDREALTIHFAPYQVAAYAAGSPEVRIPYNELRESIIKPAADAAATSTAAWWLE